MNTLARTLTSAHARRAALSQCSPTGGLRATEYRADYYDDDGGGIARCWWCGVVVIGRERKRVSEKERAARGRRRPRARARETEEILSQSAVCCAQLSRAGIATFCA